MAVTVLVLLGAAREPAVARDVLATTWRMGFDTLAQCTVPSTTLRGLLQRVEPTDAGGWLRAEVGTPAGDADLIVMYDALPHVPGPRDLNRHPDVDNVRTVRVWQRLERSLRRRLTDESWHASLTVNDRLAVRVASAVLGSTFDQRYREHHDQTATFRQPAGVVQPLSVFGERARVDLVEHGGRLAVRKTFRPGRQRYHERELMVLRDFTADIPEIPELLDAGPDYVTMARYGNTLRVDDERLNVASRLIPLHVVDAMVGAIRAFFERGYSIVDCHPGHFLLDPTAGLKIIDFEFLHEYRERPRRFEECYEFAGAPEWLDERDVPVPRWFYESSPFDYCWRPHVGLDVEVMLSSSDKVRRLRRAAFAASRDTGRALRGLRRRFRPSNRKPGSAHQPRTADTIRR